MLVVLGYYAWFIWQVYKFYFALLVVLNIYGFSKSIIGYGYKGLRGIFRILFMKWLWGGWLGEKREIADDKQIIDDWIVVEKDEDRNELSGGLEMVRFGGSI